MLISVLPQISSKKTVSFASIFLKTNVFTKQLMRGCIIGFNPLQNTHDYYAPREYQQARST